MWENYIRHQESRSFSDFSLYIILFIYLLVFFCSCAPLCFSPLKTSVCLEDDSVYPPLFNHPITHKNKSTIDNTLNQTQIYPSPVWRKNRNHGTVEKEKQLVRLYFCQNFFFFRFKYFKTLPLYLTHQHQPECFQHMFLTQLTCQLSTHKKNFF